MQAGFGNMAPIYGRDYKKSFGFRGAKGLGGQQYTE